tara:strand:- start:326 stop:751 length:426 start_codon:yes stop_codon:yes gene_type:complete
MWRNDMESKFTVNSSFQKKIDDIQIKVLGGVKEKLEDIAQTAVNLSPVDTGAYVTSFSYTVGAGRPRGKDSANLPTGASDQGKKQEGYDNLLRDITKIKKTEDLNSIQLRNGSPHADDVEYGEEWRRDGYFVFAKLRDIYG